MQQPQIKPTFKEIYDSYGLNVEDLTGPNQRHYVTITQMLKGKPVLSAYAEKVLSTLSAYVGEQYTLESVDVVLMTFEAEV